MFTVLEIKQLKASPFRILRASFTSLFHLFDKHTKSLH